MIDILYVDFRDDTAKHFKSYSEDTARAIVELCEENKLRERDYRILDIKDLKGNRSVG